MKTQCPKCRHNHSARILSFSGLGVLVQCTICHTEFLLQKDSDSGDYKRLTEKICPKCGHTQFETLSCNHCGLIFKKYKDIQTENIPDQSILSQSPAGKIKPLFRFGWATALLAISFVLILTFLAPSYRKAIGNSDLELTNKIREKVQSVQFNAARDLVRTHFGENDQKLTYWMAFIEGKETRNGYLQDGNACFRKGVLFSKRRDMTGAVYEFEEALKNYQSCNNAKFIAVTNLNLALCHRILTNNQTSMAYFEEALIIAKENGLRKYEAKALQGIGFLYNHYGLYQKALPYLEEALALHEGAADKRAEALDWLILGVIEYNRQSPEAGNCFRRALSLANEVGDMRIQARASYFLKKLLNGNTGQSPLFSRPSPLEIL
ncbi:tetratricopeptide repeat protein [Thermodesulfobacteriota bacterium]